jgi:hypothetical protein
MNRRQITIPRFQVVTIHGESDTLWHIVDTMSDSQPDIVITFHAAGSYRNGCARGTFADALECARVLNAHN